MRKHLNKIHLITVLIVTGIFIICDDAAGQSYFEVFNLNYNYSPDNSYKHAQAALTIKDMNINLKAPVLMKNGDALMFGAGGNRLLLENNTDTIQNLTLSSANLQLGYNLKFGERWQALVVFLPKISSDFMDISNEDMQYGGILLFTCTKSDKYKYKFGMYYNQEFWGPFIVPLLGFDWQPNEKWEIFGSLPISATASYHITKKLNTGLFFQAPTSSYRLSKNNYSKYLARATNELYWFNEFYLTKNLVLQEKICYSLGRSFRLYASDDKVTAKVSAFNIGDNRKQLNADADNGLVFDLKLMFRIPTSKK